VIINIAKLNGTNVKDRDYRDKVKDIVSRHKLLRVTLHHEFKVLYVRDEIKGLSHRYADRMEKHSNILKRLTS